MEQQRNIYVAGNYIAEQHIDTQFIGGTHTHVEPSTVSNQTSAFSTEDVTEFEEVPVYCRYLDPEAIRRTGIWTPAQVQQKLEEASEKDAKEFVAFLRDFERKGYLCFHGESKRKIFQTLRQQLPMMRNYSEANFYAYFWQSIWTHLNFSKRFAPLYLNPIWINARKAVTISVAAFFVLLLHRISKNNPALG